jgi:predicted flap endonuclease-1-like 5' DNA nuclease
MAETTSQRRQERRLRHANPATTTLARTSGAPFWVMAFFLLLGLGIAAVLALRGLRGPGLFTLQEAVTASGLAILAIAIILLAFLTTIGYVFGEVRRLRHLGDVRERSRVEDAARQEAVTRQLRDEVAAMRQREHLLMAELQKRRKLAAGVREREGEMHVLQLEGIGPRYATRLNSIGVVTVGQLVDADSGEVARLIETTPEQVQEWQAMGRLVQVKGVGPQWAEALARAGVRDQDDLARRDPRELAAAVARLNAGKVHVTARDPPEATVRAWIRAAGGHPARARTARPAARGGRSRSRGGGGGRKAAPESGRRPSA